MKAAIIRSAPDRLDEEVRRFQQAPLGRPVFLNGVPKCGTHLLRNIIRMFVPVEQHYAREFVQIPNLNEHMAAFAPQRPQFSVGHMLFADASVIALRGVRHLILVRDPYDYVLARARFMLSEQFDHPALNHLKGGTVTADQMINFAIFGVPGRSPALREVFTFHAAAWMGAGAEVVRYEDIVQHLKALDSPEAEGFFRTLLQKAGIDKLPADWRERVRIGADRKRSATAREHLSVKLALPKTLPDVQRRLVDFAAPGLRELFGYA